MHGMALTSGIPTNMHPVIMTYALTGIQTKKSYYLHQSAV